ncbi:MAG: hypothetical protein ABI305_11810 [Tepidiformaceae bacterium]
MATRITIGGSNRTWWVAAREAVAARTAPEPLLPLLNGLEGEISVDAGTWRAIWAWGHSMDGWTETDGTEQLTAEFEESER